MENKELISDIAVKDLVNEDVVSVFNEEEVIVVHIISVVDAVVVVSAAVDEPTRQRFTRQRQIRRQLDFARRRFLKGCDRLKCYFRRCYMRGRWNRNLLT